MEPVNYQFANPQEAILNGLKIGVGIDQVRQQRVQQQQAQQLALQQATDLRALYTNPNAGHADYAAVMTKYPGLAENLGKAYKVLDEGQKQNVLNLGSRIYSAAISGDTQTAIGLLRDRAKADPSKADMWNMQADAFEKAPQMAKTMAALQLASLMGPEKFATTFTSLQGEQRVSDQAPADLAKKVADAQAAASDATIKEEQAKVAPQTVLLDLEKKGWDIKKIKADIDIAREDNRIKAMAAAAAREGNSLKRDELKLKIAETQQKMSDGIREKAATVEAARTSMDNLLNTADRLLEKAVDPASGKPTSTIRAATGPIDSRLPTAQQDVADFEALAETLGSQAFMAQIPNLKGMGALSNAEGEKLQAALQNLSLKQSADQLIANVREAQRLILKGRKNLVTRYGVPENVPDTPAAGSNPNEVDALVKKYTSGR